MKKTNLFFLIAIACFTACLLPSCSKSDSQKLDVDKTALEFPAGSAVRELTITTTEDWEIEADGLKYAIGPNMGTADWYTVEPVFGTGNAKVTVTSKENTEGNTATLRIKYGDKVKTVQLKQADVQEGE